MSWIVWTLIVLGCLILAFEVVYPFHMIGIPILRDRMKKRKEGKDEQCETG